MESDGDSQGESEDSGNESNGSEGAWLLVARNIELACVGFALQFHWLKLEQLWEAAGSCKSFIKIM